MCFVVNAMFQTHLKIFALIPQPEISFHVEVQRRMETGADPGWSDPATSQLESFLAWKKLDSKAFEPGNTNSGGQVRFAFWDDSQAATNPLPSRRLGQREQIPSGKTSKAEQFWWAGEPNFNF